ncbi:hypothetical protein PENTCL1PPCAC_3135, partial [Pristionchus entomophagus]
EDHFVLSSMESGPYQGCVDYFIENELDHRIWHEVGNGFLCVALIVYISVNPTLLNTYKFNLVSLLLVTLMYAFGFVGFFSVPYANCYHEHTTYLTLTSKLMTVSYTFKQYFILHSLIRTPLILKYSTIGLIISLLFPTFLFIIPAADIIFDYEIFSDIMISNGLICVCGFTNLGVSIWLTLTGQTNESSFPVIIIVYEILHAFPDAIKIVSIIHDFRLFMSVENYDDIAFFITAVFTFFVLFKEKRKLA